jgi:hypothetical protein
MYTTKSLLPRSTNAETWLWEISTQQLLLAPDLKKKGHTCLFATSKKGHKSAWLNMSSMQTVRV